MDAFPKPFIQRVRYDDQFAASLEAAYGERAEDERADWITHQLNFPTVYVVRSRREYEHGYRYKVYVGETNDIKKRTRQHLFQDIKTRPDWREFSDAEDVEMYVIGHPYFNKSLTLDVENRFLHYLESCKSVERRNNRRTNEQRDYFTYEYLDRLFDEVWEELHGVEPELFESKEAITSSAIFKASPFQKLNEEQLNAQNQIFEAVNNALEEGVGDDPLDHKLILVSGEAGSGKTVLISSIFNGIMMGVEDEDERFRALAAGLDIDGTGIDGYLVSGHKNDGGQLAVYKEIIKKAGIPDSRKGGGRERVYSPTQFINRFSPDDPADVVLIDEAHLLLTQKALGYFHDQPQIEAILDRAKVVIAVYDPKQTLETPQHWEVPVEDYFADRMAQPPIRLTNQMRLNADPKTIAWIRTFVDDGLILPMRNDSKGYDLRVFSNPTDLDKAIRDKDSAVENNLSRLIATYDWPYSAAKKNEDDPDGWWYVDVEHESGSLRRPWNLQLREERKERRIAYRKAWSETPATVGEIGSTYTIQGFDLNYAGVILGPSVKYRNGRVIFDPSESAHKKAVQNRVLADGSRESFGEELLQNELNVLMTRGTRGMFIYAVDEQLREALLEAQKRKLPLVE